MITLPLLDRGGKETDKLEIPETIFGSRVNTRLLHQVVVLYQSNLRQGTASTKERGAVSGGGKKPYRQKGTGQARQGSIRSPLWVAGGAVFAPHPRDFGSKIPQKIKQVALRESLNAKYKSGGILCLEDIKEKIEKTKEFAKIITALKIKGRTLALMDGCDKSVTLAGRNIPRLSMMRAEDVNACDIMNNKTLLLTKTAFNKLLQRIQK